MLLPFRTPIRDWNLAPHARQVNARQVNPPRIAQSAAANLIQIKGQIRMGQATGHDPALKSARHRCRRGNSLGFNGS
jgi:hypothetical protein